MDWGAISRDLVARILFSKSRQAEVHTVPEADQDLYLPGLPDESVEDRCNM